MILLVVSWGLVVCTHTEIQSKNDGRRFKSRRRHEETQTKSAEHMTGKIPDAYAFSTRSEGYWA